MTRQRRRLPRTERRGQILDAAATVFGRRGFEATRMDDVAREADVAKGLLYKYFPSKDSLFEALIEQQGEEFATRLRDALTPAADATAVETLRNGLGMWVEQMTADDSGFNFADPGVHDAYDALRKRITTEIAVAIHEIDPAAREELTWLVAAGVQGAAEAVALAWKKEGATLDPAIVVELLTRFCWEGLQGLQAALHEGDDSADASR